MSLNFTHINFLPRVVFLIFILFYSCFAGGFAYFREETPNGNILECSGNSRDVVFTFSHGGGYYSMTNFYFYKNCVIGKKESNFYVINEETHGVREFNNESHFKEYLKDEKLKPLIWTRWFNYNYDASVNALFWWIAFFIFAPLPLVLPVLLIFSVISLIFGKSTRYKRTRIIYISLVGLSFVVTLLMQSYLYSI